MDPLARTAWTGVILAAGEGRRMGAISSLYPKACFPVLNEPLLHHHVRMFVAAGIHKVVVVVGFRASDVIGAARRFEAPPDLELCFVEQTERRGIAHALLLAEPELGERFVVLLGDTHFQHTELRLGIERFESAEAGASAVLSIRRVANPELIRRECTVRFDAAGRLLEIREKEQQPFNDLKPCGIYFFRAAIFDAIRKTPPSRLRNEVEITDAIQTLVSMDHNVLRAEVVGVDFNVNTPSDLLAANLAALGEKRIEVSIERGATVGENARCTASVIGAGASVGAGAKLDRVLVLPNGVVPEGSTLSDCIVGPGVMLRSERSGDRGAVVDEYPRELYLEVTNRCNLRCKTCPQFFGMPEPYADLELDRARMILEQLPPLERIVLHGIGESLLHSELGALIALAKSRAQQVLFNTNGTLLRGDRMQALIDHGLDELRISVDGAERETYREIRGADLLDTIFSNIRELNASKVRARKSTPRLSLWMTALRCNVSELPQLVERARELEIDEVYLQRLVLSEQGLATGRQSTVGAREAAEAVRAAEELAQTMSIKLRGSANTVGIQVGSRGAAGQRAWRACRRPWNLAYVTANGNLLPCCISVFTAAPYSSLLLGNVFETPIKDLWNGPAYRAWREGMLGDHPPKACERCGLDWPL